jgi:hypothetical protein
MLVKAPIVADGRHGMKAENASRPGARLTAQDTARIRTIAASLRRGSSHKPPVFGGRSAVAVARVLARELRVDLISIDLSAVVSKYIGETEKNLARIFDAAETGGAILFFDETDALFGRRTTVKDAHDRYSNAEINSLLRGLRRRHGLVLLVSKTRTALPMKLRRQFSLHRFPLADFC